MLSQFYRSALLLGQDNIIMLSGKKVAVFGVGGVGSFVVEALARGGIGSLTLIDNDTIDITNLNRQLPALLSTVGKYKTKVMAERIGDINPNCNVDTKEVFVLEDNLSEILNDSFDYVVDAVDTITTKLAIAEFCSSHCVPLISAMGTGNKLDPLKLEISDVYSTSVCPLARVMRHELRRRGVPALKVLYSREAPLSPDYTQLPPEEQEKLREKLATGKRSVPGSVSFVPPVAGLIIGGEVIKDLLNLE